MTTPSRSSPPGWDELLARYTDAFAEFRRAMGGRAAMERLEAREAALAPAVRERICAFGRPDRAWFRARLETAEGRRFAMYVGGVAPVIGWLLFDELVRAAVHELDPSFNRWLLMPALASRGTIAVHEALIGYLENGSDAEVAGAMNALYHAIRHTDPERPWPDPNLEALQDRMQRVQLRRFVERDDPALRRCLFGQMSVFPEDYDPELRPLAKKAIAIARTLDDEYIRHRIAIQEGTATHYRPLPARDAPHAEL